MNVSAYSEPDINVEPTEPEQLSEVTFTIIQNTHRFLLINIRQTSIQTLF